MKYKSTSEFRLDVENGRYKSHTSGICPGYAQANLVILSRKHAYDFLVFAFRNPKACPILAIGEAGDKTVPNSSSDSDIYKAIPKYNIFKFGELVETIDDASNYYEDDFVIFVIGCSFTFESELINAGINLKHIAQKKNVAMYNTDIELESSGIFSGKIVVSMRPIKKTDIDEVVAITSKFPAVHGSPIHIGNPDEIGIKNISKPDYGDYVEILDDEVAVFWACGVSAQNAIRNAKVETVITHSPGHMLLTDIENKSLQI